MKSNDFFKKLASKFLWGNLAAMAAVVVALCLGGKFGLDLYTHHGQGIPVPNIKGMDFDKASDLLESDGLLIVVTDSGYNKNLPANCILAQSPGYGTKVKEGHTIYVTVNSPSSPAFTIPDVIDNSSSREAMAKLQSMGFKLTQPKMVMGEKDWVYGIESQGRRVANGDLVPIDAPLTLLVGNGQYDEGSVDIDYAEHDEAETNQDIDEFEEVTEPQTKEETTEEQGHTQQTDKK